MIRLLQIDYFLEVAEQLSITGAAKKLYISQPALSKHISLMEQELGVKLFVRNGRKIALTPAGEQLKNDLKDIRFRLDKALENAATSGLQNNDPIKLGCFDGRVTDDYLPAVIRKIHDHYPEIPTLISMYNLDDVLWKLRDGDIDIAFTLESDYLPEHGYIFKRVFRRRSAIVYSESLFNEKKKQIDVPDFKDKILLIPKNIRGHMLGHHSRSRAIELGLNGDSYYENDNMSTTIMNLKLGKGYAFLAADIAESGSGLKVLELEPQYDIWIIGIVKENNSRAVDYLNMIVQQD